MVWTRHHTILTSVAAGALAVVGVAMLTLAPSGEAVASARPARMAEALDWTVCIKVSSPQALTRHPQTIQVYGCIRLMIQALHG